jgi:epoxyqueuosine reductase
VRRSEPPPDELGSDYVDELSSIAAQYGISRVGVAPAEVLGRARAEILRRRALGLHDGMQFTYKNPERSTDPRAAVRDARAVLVGARPYLADEDPGTAPEAGALSARVARYAQADHYGPLRAGLWAMAHRLRRDGWKAVAFADDNSMVDREAAYLAGLGWFGKNANLLLEGAGSWFVLGSVVTTAPLPRAAAPAADGCGSCRRCLDGCPTGAIIDAGVVDASRCLAWILQKPGIIDHRWRRLLDDRIYGCDDCQEVCPPTVRLGVRHRLSDEQVVGRRERVDILALLESDDQAVLADWGSWYLHDRDPRWARRNALVVLGNSGVGSTVRVTEVVARYLADDDPVLRAHAVWTARRLGLEHLVPTDDPHPDVAFEVSCPL